MFSTASASSSSALLFRQQQQQQQQQQHRRAMESASGGGGGGGGGGQQQHQTKKKQQQQQQKQQQAAPGKRCLSLDETLGCIFEHLRDPDDRRNISLVSKQWHRVDGETRKYVSVSNCYSIAPSALSKRFKNLESFKLKGKPRAVEFDLLVDNWGGYAGPWIQELVKAYPSLKHLHLHRMEVLDTDLELLAHGCGAALQVLKLSKCQGFSTAGLKSIAQACRSLRMLNLEESKMDDQRGEWLFHLGDNNPRLESLNITSTDLDELNIREGLLSLVQKCPALSSLKMGEIELETLKEIMKYMSMRLEAFGAGCYTLQEEDRLVTAFIPWVTKLKILDLKYTSLSAEGHCQILTYCFCLEELEVSNVLGDKGLEVVGKTSKRLKRLRVDDHEDGLGTITHRGLTAIAEGCQELKFLVMYLSDVTNASLADVGRCLTKLTDFRIVLLQTSQLVKDLPLDAGVQSVLQGCPNLTRFSVYLRIGGLTDRGVSYIGTHGGKLKWVLLGCCGDIGSGLLNLAQGCQKIERLELRDCPIEDAQLANVFLSMRSLKYFWVEGFGATEAVGQYLAALVPYLHVEVMPYRKQLLAYYSLTSPRTDNPPTVQVLTHDSWQGQQ